MKNDTVEQIIKLLVSAFDWKILDDQNYRDLSIWVLDFLKHEDSTIPLLDLARKFDKEFGHIGE